MVAGNLAIDSLLQQDSQINSPDVQYPVVAFSLLLVFVVLMPILFLNLLVCSYFINFTTDQPINSIQTSLAVGDIVQEIEKKSDTYRLRLRVRTGCV